MSNLFVGNSPAPAHQSPPGWLWLKTAESSLDVHTFVDGAWVKSAAISYDTHSHDTFGNIAFTGTITIDELKAKTVAIPYTKPGGGTGTLQFHDGLLVNNT